MLVLNLINYALIKNVNVAKADLLCVTLHLTLQMTLQIQQYFNFTKALNDVHHRNFKHFLPYKSETENQKLKDTCHHCR